ncbi:hypothetical protein [uncultured Roseobacter sp.]|nr:hypothetical protein [uncultured Roseobacter sp.]
MNSKVIEQRKREAIALVRKEGLSASEPVCATGSSRPANGLAFLKQHVG